ncbi:MAG: hypothetical protein B7C24_15075 [Bacteroidetes bacterium 4572_77]|nr:MAG: hypothetical protein B7C24_15075 [Bacteroidetes bacterium 4572_77]
MPSEGMYLDLSDSLLTFLNQNAELDYYEPVISGKALVISDFGNKLINIMSYKSIDSGYYYDLYSTSIVGTPSVEFRPSGIYLGSKIIEDLKLQPTDGVNMLSPIGLERALVNFRPPPKNRTEVTGVIYSNVKNINENLGLLSYDIAKKLLKVKNNQYSQIDIKLKDKYNISIFENKLNAYFGVGRFFLTNWQKLNSKLLAVMKMERYSTFLILGLIIMISVFNILMSITMTVLEKKQDIGILRSMGASKRDINKIFFTEGLLIGSISTVAGVAIGLLFCYLQINFKLFKLDMNYYVVDSIPISISPLFVVLTALFAFLLAASASIYPAYIAGKVNIASALKEE